MVHFPALLRVLSSFPAHIRSDPAQLPVLLHAQTLKQASNTVISGLSGCYVSYEMHNYDATIGQIILGLVSQHMLVVVPRAHLG